MSYLTSHSLLLFPLRSFPSPSSVPDQTEPRAVLTCLPIVLLSPVIYINLQMPRHEYASSFNRTDLSSSFLLSSHTSVEAATGSIILLINDKCEARREEKDNSRPRRRPEQGLEDTDVLWRWR